MTPRAHLQVFLGYAAGVGKTYAMLEEAQRQKRQGQDVVIGYFEPHGRKDTIALTRGLETVPRRRQEYRETVFWVMDTEAVLERRPALCVVDELPHTNAPGSPRAKRWQDVEVLVENGIAVLTTMNVQHLESLNDQVWQISGVRVRETVPDWVVGEASEVVMVDLTPRALIHRLERGVIYPVEKAEMALSRFFKEATLSALRELTLRQTAHVTEYRQEAEAAPQAQSGDRILIHVSADPTTAMALRRGKRVADYLHADCLAVYVRPEGEVATETAAAVEKHLAFARNLRIEARTIEARAGKGGGVAEALVEFARQHRITQIFTGRASNGEYPLLSRMVRLARDMQVTIVANRGRREGR